MNQLFLEAELEQLLKEEISSVINREKSTFEELTAPFSNSLVLFGCGNLGKKTLAGLRSLGIEPIAFADNNPALWGKSVDGVQVMSLQKAAEKFGDCAAFVITIWSGEGVDKMTQRKQQLMDVNCSKVVSFNSLFWKYPEVFLPHYSRDLPHKVYQQADELRKVLSLWEDDASRHEYLDQLKWRMLLDFDDLNPPVTHEIYFPNDLVTILPDEIFVDCGAFDGDTLRKFIQNQSASFSKIIGFEADPANFQKLEKYVSKLPHNIKDKITIHQLAIGARKEKLRFNATGTAASAVGSGTLEVDCITLDEILSNSKPTYIKMDIEGSELDAIIGSHKLIGQFSPVLAICVYHSQDHLWKIPLLIHSMSNQYRFFLRPHLLESWDLVCYAIPVNRLKV